MRQGLQRGYCRKRGRQEAARARYSVVIEMDAWYNFIAEEIAVNGAAGERTERQRNERSDRE